MGAAPAFLEEEEISKNLAANSKSHVNGNRTIER
jgi:hypothetical protein